MTGFVSHEIESGMSREWRLMSDSICRLPDSPAGVRASSRLRAEPLGILHIGDHDPLGWGGGRVASICVGGLTVEMG